MLHSLDFIPSIVPNDTDVTDARFPSANSRSSRLLVRKIPRFEVVHKEALRIVDDRVDDVVVEPLARRRAGEAAVAVEGHAAAVRADPQASSPSK